MYSMLLLVIRAMESNVYEKQMHILYMGSNLCCLLAKTIHFEHRLGFVYILDSHKTNMQLVCDFLRRVEY